MIVRPPSGPGRAVLPQWAPLGLGSAARSSRGGRNVDAMATAPSPTPKEPTGWRKMLSESIAPTPMHVTTIPTPTTTQPYHVRMFLNGAGKAFVRDIGIYEVDRDKPLFPTTPAKEESHS